MSKHNLYNKPSDPRKHLKLPQEIITKNISIYFEYDRDPRTNECFYSANSILNAIEKLKAQYTDVDLSTVKFGSNGLYFVANVKNEKYDAQLSAYNQAIAQSMKLI